jgi:hypothetical protein
MIIIENKDTGIQIKNCNMYNDLIGVDATNTLASHI